MIDALLGLARPRAGKGWVNKGPLDDYWYTPRVSPTGAGVEIDEDAAMRFSTVYACVAKLAKTVASLPVSVVERISEGERRPTDHPLNELLTSDANEDDTGFTIREAILGHLLLWGTAYCEVRTNEAGEPAALDIMQTGSVAPKRMDTGEIVYIQRMPDGGQRGVPESRVWRIPGLSFNGIVGLSPIAYQREALGLAVAATRFGSSFFGNGAWAGGFIQQPLDAPELSPEAGQKLLEDLVTRFRGPDKAFGFGLLREGLQFKQIDMPLEDAQFLQLRQFQREEVCSIFDVPPTKIGDLSKGTYANTEQQDLAWAKDSIMPWLVRIEMSARKRFFSGTKLHLRHNLAGLVRGDLQTRYNAYATGRQWGWLSVNDIRRNEDMNPVDGGEEYLRPMNMEVVGDEQQTGMTRIGTPSIADDSAECVVAVIGESVEQIVGAVTNCVGEHHSESMACISDIHQQIAEALEVNSSETADVTECLSPVIEDTATRIVTKEHKAIAGSFKRRHKDRSASSFVEWLDKFAGEHEAWIVAVVEPLSVAAKTPKDVVSRFAQDRAARIAHLFRQAAEGQANGGDLVVPVLAAWERDEPAAVAKAIRGILTVTNGQKGRDNE